MLVEQRVEVRGQDGVVQERTGKRGAGQGKAGAGEAWTRWTIGLTRRELRSGWRGTWRGHQVLQHRFAVLLSVLVTGENGIHTKLQQRLVA